MIIVAKDPEKDFNITLIQYYTNVTKSIFMFLNNFPFLTIYDHSIIIIIERKRTNFFVKVYLLCYFQEFCV